MDRRQFITVGLLGGMTLLAGCSGGDGGGGGAGTTTLQTGGDGDTEPVSDPTTVDSAYEPEEVDADPEPTIRIFDRPTSYAFSVTGEMENPWSERGPVSATGRVDANENAYEQFTMTVAGFESTTEVYFVDGTAYSLYEDECQDDGSTYSPGLGGYAGFELWETPIAGYGITDPVGTETVGGEVSDIYSFVLDVNEERADAFDSAVSGAGVVKEYTLDFAVGQETGYLRRATTFQHMTIDGGTYVYDLVTEYSAFDEAHTVTLPSGC